MKINSFIRTRQELYLGMWHWLGSRCRLGSVVFKIMKMNWRDSPGYCKIHSVVEGRGVVEVCVLEGVDGHHPLGWIDKRGASTFQHKIVYFPSDWSSFAA